MLTVMGKLTKEGWRCWRVLETVLFDVLTAPPPRDVFEQYNSRGVRRLQFGSFGWCAPLGCSSIATPGEFDDSNLQVLIGALPRGVRKC